MRGIIALLGRIKQCQRVFSRYAEQEKNDVSSDRWMFGVPRGALLEGVCSRDHSSIVENTADKLNADGQIVLEPAWDADGRQPAQVSNPAKWVGEVKRLVVELHFDGRGGNRLRGC